MNATDVSREVVDILRTENVTFKAAAITYYALASFIPLLVVTLAVLSLFGAADTLVQALQSNLPQSGAEMLNQVLTGTQDHVAVGAIGLFVALWSAIKVFRGMIVAFDGIYRVGSDLSLLGQVEKSLLALGLLFLGFVLLAAVSVALTYVTFPIPFQTLVGNVVAVLALALAFLPLYHVLPPVRSLSGTRSRGRSSPRSAGYFSRSRSSTTPIMPAVTPPTAPWAPPSCSSRSPTSGPSSSCSARWSTSPSNPV
jgi:membrane protein